MTLAPPTGHDLYGLIQAIVRAEIGRLRFAEIAEVTELHPHADEGDHDNYAVTVSLRDSELVLPKVPVATSRIGQVAIPDVGELVLVQFVGGDLHRPVVTGRLYNDEDRPPASGPGEWVYESPHAEEDGVRRIHIALPGSNTITVTDAEATIDLGGTRIVVESGGKVSIECPADVEIGADGGISLHAGGDIAIEAGGKVDIKAQSDLTAEGLNATVKGQANAAIEGAAETTVKGAMVKIAGMTNFSAG
ncbi:MAG: hypothetical protein H6983_23875 [Ectothiorhodospiraceae bacterium]|nr:hypothetical protein [Chromatiales bacterium]MCP5157237.1 hypothetical protein [Ectothiorhodospiraceae bacterium]